MTGIYRRAMRRAAEHTTSESLYVKNAHIASKLMRIVTVVSAILTAGALFTVIGYILIKGVPHLTPSMFEWKYTSVNVSLMPALINTIYMTTAALVIAVPVGLGAAVYLTEYAKRRSKLIVLVRLTVETLSGIPSIVYGLFGSLFFVKSLHMGLSLAAGALTLSIMILPLIIRTAEEALRAVSDSLREGSYGLGAGRLRTVMHISLPSAMPGILSGVILAIGRIVGESAALLFTAGTVAEAAGLTDSARTLAVHMYAISGEGMYIDKTYATAVVLIVLVLIINGVAEFIARKAGNNNGQN